MLTVSNNIKSAGDTEYFANSFASTETIPGDFALSDLQAVDLAKRAFIRGKANEITLENEDENLSALSAKKGRKLASEKIKSIEKEISEVEKKAEGIDSLLNPASTNVSYFLM